MCMLAYFVNLLFLGHAFTIMLVYIWSRRNPGIRMNFFGLITFQAPYLPWVLLAFSILLGSSTVVDIIGIIVGHFYYFFEDVFPNEPHGFKVLETPRFIRDIFERFGIDEPPLPEEERPEQFNFANDQPPNQPPPSSPPSGSTNNSNNDSSSERAPQAGTPDEPPSDELDRRNHRRNNEHEQGLRARNVGGTG